VCGDGTELRRPRRRRREERLGESVDPERRAQTRSTQTQNLLILGQTMRGCPCPCRTSDSGSGLGCEEGSGFIIIILLSCEPNQVANEDQMVVSTHLRSQRPIIDRQQMRNRIRRP
jgi:hypothetical protein